MTKRLVLIGAAFMTTILALVLFWQFRVAVMYVLISLMVGAALRPLVTRLAGRGFVVRTAWILLYLVVLVGFGFLLFQSGETAIHEIQRLTESVSVQDKWTLPIWLEDSLFENTLLARLPAPSILIEAITGDQGQRILPTLLGLTQGIGVVVSAVFVIIFLSTYWSISQIHFERLWLSLLPSGQRKQARDIWQTIELEIGDYLRGQVIYSILVGLLLVLGYWLIGSPSPVLLALGGALVCLIPVFGPILAVILPLLLGLLTSVELSLFTVLYTVAVLIGLGMWVKPKLFNRTWDNPILMIVLLVALADALGLVGVIIAPPLSVIGQILWRRLVSHRLLSAPAAQISDLKEREKRIRDVIEGMDEPPPPLIISSLERLVRLMNEAEPVLQETVPEVTPE